MLETALRAAKVGDRDLLAAMDELAAPIYITDRDGLITYYNRACIAFAGRTPVIRHDRWCVTWKLYTLEGEALPHDQCPMAVAIRERRAVRGTQAVAERPNGSRIHFVPYPTPLFDDEGGLAGAVNLLVDVTEREQARYLREQAARCRRLAGSVGDQRTIATLRGMAIEYDERAVQIEQPN